MLLISYENASEKPRLLPRLT